MINLSNTSDIMQPLNKELRRKLETVVEQAREVAETAAKASLQQLGIGDPSPSGFLSIAERDLRKKLRSHARQLGDLRDAKTETQEIDRLIEEVAYEHWHRMLFARFLAENDLLMYPGVSHVPVTLDECEELAVEEGARNGWELASRFAGQMLPQVFRIESPVFEIVLPPEHEHTLETLLKSLPPEVFTASDALGWIYQYWQSRRKNEINASEMKVGARELPAVTQLFTEPYMVNFLLDNSLGAWWAHRRLTDGDSVGATSEETLRMKVRLPGVPLKYLRFVQSQNGCWVNAAGNFDTWPEKLSEFKVIDPCCGSGHFLVATLQMLVPMRMELEKISAAEAVDRVLAENIHGLEIDRRCVELAAFALALNAWRYPAAGGYRTLPKLNIACSGISVSAAKEEWRQLAVGKGNLRIALDWLHDTFNDAPLIGSLLNPAGSDATKIVSWEDLSIILEQAISQESTDDQREAVVVAQGLSMASLLLARKYNLVVTNVPYLSRGKQTERLRQFCERYYPQSKNDLATVFLDRCLELCVQGGMTSIVLPQNWLFLTSYQKFRERLLRTNSWKFIVRLGAKGFQTQMWDFNVQLLMIESGQKSNDFNSAGVIRGIDVSDSRTAGEKATALLTMDIKSIQQSKQLENPDATVKLEEPSTDGYVRDYARCYQGLTTGDDPRLKRFFWEIDNRSPRWKRLQGPSQGKGLFYGRENMVDIRITTGAVRTGALRGREAWGKRGVAVDRVQSLSAALYCGDYYHSLIPVLIPNKEDDFLALLAFACSDELRSSARGANQALSIDNGYFEKFEFNLSYWKQKSIQMFPNGVPKIYSEDPSQWVFHGNPVRSLQPLQVAVARLVGYNWPAEIDDDFDDMSEESQVLIKNCSNLKSHVDEDGIVCIPPVRGEIAASERLHNILAAAYGSDWNGDKLADLLKTADHAGKSLDSWLRDRFFSQHCKMFQSHPIVWHIWDGLRDGFAALVNYQRLDRKLLETLIYTYLGDWITRQKQDYANNVDGSAERLSAAEQLKKRLELILTGESPFDIFVRWKGIEEQSIGWDPDLNDGVRINIRPFLTVPDIGKKGAGILRDRPNIDWKKDRGKDTSIAPWYGVFNGDRINDHHLTLSEKQAARANKSK